VSFQSPYWLIALLVVPVLVLLYIRRERGRNAYAAQFANPALLPNLVARTPGWRRHLPVAILLVALAAMVVGVARPHATVTVPREEATVILAIDVSRSMASEDVKPTRLDAARAAAKAFLGKVPEKFRVGVISFASRAVVGVPPTADRSLVRASLDSLHPGEGTALGDAVALAVRMGQRQRRSDGSRPPTAVLMISDGTNMGGRTTPQAAAQRARAQHVPVYTVMVGTPDGVVEQKLTGGFTQIVRVPPSPVTLRQVSRTTGGEFFTATDDKRLRQVYERLGSRIGHRSEDREITDVFAGGSAALLLAGGALSMLWFRRVP
jgi:Ca-activated chloride channel family protein